MVDGDHDAEAHERRLPRTAVAAAIRLFFLELPVSRLEAERALGARAVDALERTKLARIDADALEPLARIAPVGPILLASDRLSTDPTSDPPDYVSTAKVLDMLMAVPKFGQVKAKRYLNQCRIAESKTIGGLSDRQRAELVGLFDH